MIRMRILLTKPAFSEFFFFFEEKMITCTYFESHLMKKKIVPVCRESVLAIPSPIFAEGRGGGAVHRLGLSLLFNFER